MATRIDTGIDYQRLAAVKRRFPDGDIGDVPPIAPTDNGDRRDGKNPDHRRLITAIKLGIPAAVGVGMIIGELISNVAR